MLREAQAIRGMSLDARDEQRGALSIATTHTQARYALPPVVAEFRRRYPKVKLAIQQGKPQQIVEMLERGDADIGIATESLDDSPALLALPGYEWWHTVVVPAGHPLAAEQRLSLETLAKWPIVTYSAEFTGRSHIDEAFAARGLAFEVVLTGIDSDVIKTYVELGLGVGIIAEMAFDPDRDQSLRVLDARHLFRVNTTRVAIRRGALLRGFAYDFIELFAPRLTRKGIERAAAAEREAESFEI
jgi:LysR family cys regulon transcriptional activator